MAYLALKNIIDARNYVEENIKKPDTFIGLVLFLLCVLEEKRNGSYLKSDMRKFSEYVDNAFYLSDSTISYSEKYWFALLTNDWVAQVKEHFLKIEKVSASKVMTSIFWSSSFHEIQSKMRLIPDDFFEHLFLDDLAESDFSESNSVKKSDILLKYNGAPDAVTLKFDGTFVKKRASDLSGAPFAQTLYAGTEIKKIISIFDFDFIEKFDLDVSGKKVNFRLSSTVMILPKPFLLLAGISGTGKTRFVRKQAEASRKFAETFGLTVNRDDIYCLTSVRPDWHEPSDLLGYISRLGKDGEAEFITTDVLQFIAKAWLAIADCGLTIKAQDFEALGKRLVVTGERKALGCVFAHWLCLDEMNLAPVEQYFADYLSVIETREWVWNGDDTFTYSSDALLKPATIESIANKLKLREALAFGGAKYDELWELICKYGLGIPFNLVVAGTVNMDETTHGFSRKVIDRALTFDFGEFFPNDFDAFFEDEEQAQKCPITLGYPIASQARQSSVVAKASRDFLNVINNGPLKDTPFELAYRALNELLLLVQSFAPNDSELVKLQAIWDDFLMMKVLPRIEGDDEKAADVLAELEQLLSDQLKAIWSDDAKRPDLWRDTNDNIPCRSKKKIAWMRARLSAGFTSFWP